MNLNLNLKKIVVFQDLGLKLISNRYMLLLIVDFKRSIFIYLTFNNIDIIY